MSVSEDLKPLLKAKVVDIRNRAVQPCPSYLVDTNVLVYSTYDRYDQQRLLGKNVPTDDQIDEYLTYEKIARVAGSHLYIASSAVFEFLRTVEYSELQILCATLDPRAAHGDFSSFDPKKVRRLAVGRGYAEAQERIMIYLRSLCKRFKLLESITPFSEMVERFWGKWSGAVIDTGDGLQLADATKSGITTVLSADQDFSTFQGITLYTGNRTVIDTARSVGLLVNK